MFDLIVNLLGTVVAGLCAVLLLRAFRAVRRRLLLWAGLCFAALSASNAMVVVDQFVLPDVNLYVWRLAIAATGMLLLVYGLIVESDRS